MEVERILIRVVVSYLFLLILLRLSAKRTIAESTSFDFVLAIIIGELFDGYCWKEVPAGKFMAAVGTIFMLDGIIKLWVYFDKRFARLVDFPPEVMMRDGKPMREVLRAEQISENDLEMMIRHKAGIERNEWVEVAVARIESSGKPSVIKHEWAKNARKADAGRLATHGSGGTQSPDRPTE
jgi:uncharacterized membrane protein YcaP (DUF421 family)